MSWLTERPMVMVWAALAELAAMDARRVLHLADAVALGTGSFRSKHDARRVRESYQQAIRPPAVSAAMSEPPTEAEREAFGLDLIEQMRADGMMVH